MKYKIVSEDMIKNLVTFLDEIQFDASSSKNVDDMQKVNFCSYAIEELLNSYDAYIANSDKSKLDKKSGKKPNPKSRDQYRDETFMDWNLPEMSDDEYEKLVDQFDAFLRGWEKEYNKNNPKKKPIKERPRFHRPHINDVSEYMSLKEIKEFLLDDPELTDQERFELYYEEHDRVQIEKERKKKEKGAVSYDKMLKDLGISPSTNDKGDKDVTDNK